MAAPRGVPATDKRGMRREEAYALGLDVGGTKMAGGIVDLCRGQRLR